MSFVAPWFLLALAAAAIPLVLHLRRAQRKTKLVFSTTAFFNEQFLKTARRAKLQDRLLMILRMALFALFALALAQPLIRLPWMTSLLAPLSGKQHVAIVLDDSASMGLADADGRLLDRAKAAAIDLVDGLSTARGDAVTVVLAGQRDAGPRVLFDPPTADLDQVRQAIRAVELTDLATDLPAAVAAAEKAFAAQPARQVFVLSDFASTALSADTPLAAGGTTTLVLLATRPKQMPAENISLDAVQFGAARPMLGIPFAFRTQVTNGTRQPHKLGLNLVVDDAVVAHRDIDLSAGASDVVRFVHRFSHTGWHQGRIEWDGAPVAGETPAVDAIAADNRRVFAVAVERQLKILAVDGAPAALPGSDELFFFRTALSLDPAGQGSAARDAKGDSAAGGKQRLIALETVAAGELPAVRLEEFSVVLLANVPSLPPPAIEKLERYVDKGGSLLITLGDRVDRDRYNELIGPGRMHGGLLPGKLGDRVTGSAAGFLAWMADAHPATAGFDSGALGNLSGVTFAERYRLEPQGADVLMQSDGGDPVLLVKSCGLGRVMLFASTVDRDWTNLPLSPLFVPLVYRLVGYLAQPQGYGDNFYATGSEIALPASVTAAEQPLRVIDPAGHATALEKS
ncbi:MAG TPA: BatA and WFA domain-containing protein, partial [Pirellulales bacterium]|nr:BatA and WFA domain-containing protein [Pirellulales bacterium]